MRPVGDMDSGLDGLHVKGILAFWDCYNKIQWTGWLINIFFFLTVLETGKYKIKALAGMVSGEDLLSRS